MTPFCAAVNRVRMMILTRFCEVWIGSRGLLLYLQFYETDFLLPRGVLRIFDACETAAAVGRVETGFGHERLINGHN